MAINFANYLGQSYKPDLSGIGDLVENLGKGYSIGRMPDTMREEQEGRMRDNAIKAIQQKFLPQEKQAGLDNLKLDISAKKQAALQEALLNQAYGDAYTKGGAQPSTPGLAQAPASTPQDFKGVQFRMNEPGVNKGQPMTDNASRASGGFSHPSQSSGGEVLSEGSPSMYGLDNLYETNPMARPLMDKRGLKKTQDVKYDSKTGETRITTTWPSGRIEVQRSGGNAGGVKNTNAVITKAQNTVNGVVNALPILDDLIADVKAGKIPGTLLGGTFKRDQHANYASNISESAETLANALGYPNTEGGFLQAEKVVARDFGESDNNYEKRLIRLKEKMKKRSLNAKDVLNNANPKDFSYLSDEELEKIASGDA